MENNNESEYTNSEDMSKNVNTGDGETFAEEPTSTETAVTPGKKEEGSFFKPTAVKGGDKRIKVPLWVMIISILVAATVVFQTTYVVLTDLYERELNAHKINVISENQRTSELDEKLSRTYSAIDQISEIFNHHYIYDVDYDTLIENILYDYVAETGDKYAEYYSADEYRAMMDDSAGNSVGIGTYVTYGSNENELDKNLNLLKGVYISYVMSDSPAEKAGIEVGDIITAVDGVSLVGVYYGDAVDMVKGEFGSTVTLTVERDGKTMDIDVVRGNYSVETVLHRTIEQSGHKIGYLRIIQFYEVTYNQFKNAIADLLGDGCEGIIFDLRSDGGGFLDSVCNILDYILPKGPIVKLVFADGTTNEIDSNSNCIKNIPMVVLVDGDTASAAELFTSALMDYDYATVIGTTTYGKGCGQNFFALNNGGYIKLTTFLYNPPYSDNYDGIGITPDIVVERYDEVKNTNLFYLTYDEDAQLKAAVENILSKLK